MIDVRSRATCWLAVTWLLAASPLGVQADDEKAYRVEWHGVMDTGDRVFRFVIESSREAVDRETHWLRSLDEGNARFRLDPYSLEGGRMAFALPQTVAEYSGDLSEDARRAAGNWKQRGASFTLVFDRVEREPDVAILESWVGTLDLVVRKIQIRFRVLPGNEGGPPLVLMDSVTQRAGGFRCERTIDGSKWTIRVPGIRGTFTGEFDDQRKEVRGSWAQSGIPLPITLTQGEAADPGPPPRPNRPQTPKAPFPYAVEPAEFASRDADVVLRGTLTLPAGDDGGPCAAVVLISGSGPQDRDETIFDHKPFWVIADHLTRRGIAVLRYDDRGVGESKGDAASATSEHFARDVDGAIDFLRKHARIDGERIGLIGHSEGAIIAPLVATRRPDVAFVVLLAGPGVPGDRILRSQGELGLKATGLATEEALRLQRVAQDAILDAVLAATPDESNDDVAKRAVERARRDVSEAVFTSAGLDAAIPQGVAQLRLPWFRFFLSHDPAPVLRELRCPVLSLHGARDTQVDPELNAPVIRQSLTDGGNRAFEVTILPELNHLFQTSKTGGVGEYASIEETIAPAALDALTRWITERTSRAP
ncbi:MAG: alpha/beta hydrolase [Planctomycetes bacterium]|nr:alpha/beta hydrolase [Planctomycetota bacterium]